MEKVSRVILWLYIFFLSYPHMYKDGSRKYGSWVSLVGSTRDAHMIGLRRVRGLNHFICRTQIMCLRFRIRICEFKMLKTRKYVNK
jgi:hypothetical protein